MDFDKAVEEFKMKKMPLSKLLLLLPTNYEHDRVVTCIGETKGYPEYIETKLQSRKIRVRRVSFIEHPILFCRAVELYMEGDKVQYK
jgi:hypothetical protein